MSDDLFIDRRLTIPGYAITWTAIRASGPGGQSVNKTSSAVQLRCDLNSFHMPDAYRRRISAHRDARITDRGEIVITARTHRSQPRNLDAARDRLKSLIRAAIKVDPPRRKTRPSRSSVRRGIRAAKRRSEIKALRGRVRPDP